MSQYTKPPLEIDNLMPIDEARRQGYIAYAGPYAPVAEREMLDNAVADIVRNRRDKYCIVRDGKSRVEIWIIPNALKTNMYREVKDA